MRTPLKCGPMRTVAPLLALVIGLTTGWSAEAAPVRRAATAPVVVELYTSQGCSACAKANGLVADLAKDKTVLPLTFAVDYWDYLGWTDTFAKPEFTARQRAYMRKLSQRDVYTPQVIVDGRSQAAGVRPDKVQALIRQASKDRVRPPRLSIFASNFVRLEAGAAPKGGADVWLVRYEPKSEPVEVTEGESRGQTVAYANAVRELTRLGSWTGRRRTFALPQTDAKGLKTVILVQGSKGGRILGVLHR